jgi:hypothetical protein
MSTLNAITSGAGGVSLSGDTSGNVQIQSAGANSAVFNSFGIGLGNTAPTSGLGITFPATQSASSNANTLDDYEEGTWTPTQGANLTVVGTFTSLGNYTKIGRMVYASGYLGGSTSIAWTSGGTVAEGLPFFAITSPQQPGSGIIGSTTVGHTTLAYGFAVYVANSQAATSGLFFNIAYQI